MSCNNLSLRLIPQEKWVLEKYLSSVQRTIDQIELGVVHDRVALAQ